MIYLQLLSEIASVLSIPFSILGLIFTYRMIRQSERNLRDYIKNDVKEDQYNHCTFYGGMH